MKIYCFFFIFFFEAELQSLWHITPTLAMFTSLLPFLLLSAQALAQIPEAFTKGFDPDTIELVVRYPESGKIQDGENLSVNGW